MPVSDPKARFLDLAFANPGNRAIYERMLESDLPNWTLVSGCLFQTVWNMLDGRPPAEGIKDYDLFYFDDTDLSWEAEDRRIRQVDALMSDLELPIETRNQARVHLWYEDHFGETYAPLKCVFEGIDRFLSPCCMFGLYPGKDGAPEVYAPMGYQDLFDRIVRPNPAAKGEEHYYAKAERWQREWPSLTLLPWTN